MTHADGCPAAHNPRHGCACATPTVHAGPEDGSAVTPCCGRSPFELPLSDRMTYEPALVTCTTQTSSTGPVSSYPPTRVLPTSRGPGEEREYGTPTDQEEKMCGCDCCQNSDPTCFDPQALEASGDDYYGWACKCACPGCIAQVIRGAIAWGGRATRDSLRDEVTYAETDAAYAKGRVDVMREWANTTGFDLATLVGFDATAQLVAAVSEYQGQRDALAAADAVVAVMPTAFWINSSTEEAQDHKRHVRSAIAALDGVQR